MRTFSVSIAPPPVSAFPSVSRIGGAPAAILCRACPAPRRVLAVTMVEGPGGVATGSGSHPGPHQQSPFAGLFVKNDVQKVSKGSPFVNRLDAPRTTRFAGGDEPEIQVGR